MAGSQPRLVQWEMSNPSRYGSHRDQGFFDSVAAEFEALQQDVTKRRMVTGISLLCQ